MIYLLQFRKKVTTWLTIKVVSLSYMYCQTTERALRISVA